MDSIEEEVCRYKKFSGLKQHVLAFRDDTITLFKNLPITGVQKLNNTCISVTGFPDKVDCLLSLLPYFLDYFLRVLLISDRTYPQVQYKGRNKTRAGSINFSLVWHALQSRVGHSNAHD